jgi:hypothetical protein
MGRLADRARTRSILALHALLFGEGVVEADSGISGKAADALGPEGGLEPSALRSASSVLAQYGLLFGLGRGSSPPIDAAAVPDASRLIDGLYAAPSARPRPATAGATARGPSGDKAFRLEDYGASVEGPGTWPADIAAGDSVCAFRTDAGSRYTILMLAPALSARPDSGPMGESRLLLGGRVAYLVFEPSSYKHHYREFFLRDEGHSLPFRFEEMREFPLPGHDRIFIPNREAPPFPIRVPLGGQLEGAYLVRGEGSEARLKDFLYRFLNSRTGLTFGALRRPVAALVEARFPEAVNGTRP